MRIKFRNNFTFAILIIFLITLTTAETSIVPLPEMSNADKLYEMALENHEIAIYVVNSPPTYENELLRSTAVDVACGIVQMGKAFNEKYHKSWEKATETLTLIDTNCVVR